MPTYCSQAFLCSDKTARKIWAQLEPAGLLIWLICLSAILLSSPVNGTSLKADKSEHPTSLAPPASIDTEQHNWETHPIIDLDEGWRFSWQRWRPEHMDRAAIDYSNSRASSNSTLIPSAKNDQEGWHDLAVPGPWTHAHSDIQGEGFGTLQLSVKLASDTPRLYLSLPDMASAYELWINGELIAKRGTLGESKSSEQPEYGPGVYHVSAQNALLDIRILSSNYHYQWGGFWYTPQLLSEDALFEVRDLPIIEGAITSTILIASGILSLLMFLSRPQDRKVMYFGLLCWVIGIRRALIEERIVHQWGVLPWEVLQSLENISIYLMLPLLISYLHHLFPQEFKLKLVKLAWLAASPFCLAAIVLDVSLYTQFNVPFQVVALGFALPVYYHYWRALKRKRQGAKLFGLSLLLFSLAALNDALYYSYVIETLNLLHLGTLAFVLFQLGGLINRYLKNFKKIEVMTADLQSKNQALQSMDAYKDDFLAATSHELRTPLHSISALAKLISQDHNTLSSNQTQSLQLIEATSSRLNTLVNDLLDASSIKHKKLLLNIRPVAVEPSCKRLLDSMRPLLRDKSVELLFESTLAQTDQVMADEQRLQQVLTNLLGNAIKYTEQGHIQLTLARVTQASKAYVAFVLTDTGIGIAKDKQSQLFVPFEQLSASGLPFKESSGLGLSISKELIELQEGTINIESELGQGTTVTLLLPLASSNAASPSPIERAHTSQTSTQSNNAAETNETERLTPNIPPHHPPLQPADVEAKESSARRVFYADDEAVNREVISRMLEHSQFSVETFASAKQLLEALKQAQPDVILLDLVMPEMDGIQACKKIREDFHSAKLPILMLTARHQPKDIVDALNAGANDYLTKPTHEAELIARLHSQLSVRDLWQRERENHTLHRKLLEKEQSLLQLEQSHNRLHKAIDASPNAIIMLSLDLNIIHANAASSELLDTPVPALLGEQFLPFLASNSQVTLKEFLRSDLSQRKISLEVCERAVDVTIQSDENEHALLLSFGAINSGAGGQNRPSSATKESVFGELLHELSENRKRIEQIEHTIFELAPDGVKDRSKTGHLSEPSKSNKTEQDDSIRPYATASESGQKGDAAPEHIQDTAELIVKTMRLAISTWERHAKKSKVDFAEQSRLWSVYLDGNSAKTRTLDKYLSTKSLPSKPRWRSVINSTRFVIEQCELPEATRLQLDDYADQIDQRFS